MVAVIAFILSVLALAGAGAVSYALPPLLGVLLGVMILRRTDFHRDALNATVFLAIVFVVLTLTPLPSALFAGARSQVVERASAAIATSRSVVPAIILQDQLALQDEPVPPRWRPLTMNVAGTARFAVMAALSACLFAWVRGQDAPARRRAVRCVVWFAAAVAVCGLVGRYVIPQGKTLFWMIPVRHGQPMGPFVNRNHFALLCAMCAPLALSLAVQPRLAVGGDSEAEFSMATGRARQAFFALLHAGCFIVLVAGAFHSLSRSGSLAVLSGVFVTALLWVRARPWMAAVAVVLAVVAIAGFVLISHGGVGERRETLRNPLETASARHRLSMWGSGLRMWRDFPISGVGAEGFRTVYPAYKTNTSRKSALQAENEYVQVLCEGGLIGAGVFFVFWSLWARRFLCVHGAAALMELLPGRRRRDSRKVVGGVARSPGLFYAACGVVVCVAVHCLFEFGLRMPLNAAVLAVVLAAAVPMEDGRHAPGKSYASGRMAGLGWMRWIGAPLLAVLVPFILLLGWRDVDSLDKDWGVRHAPMHSVERAIWWAPLHWPAWHALSQRHLDRARLVAKETGVVSPQALDFALYCAEVAVDCNRNDYRLWQSLAELRSQLGFSTQSAAAARRSVELRPYLDNEMRPYLELDTGSGFVEDL